MSKRVFIGVGHGGKDPGAVAYGLTESEINLTMALACQKELVRHGVIVGMSRVIEENDPLSEEIREANAFKPDIAIEIHNNAGGGDGFEAYRQDNQYKAESIKLAQLIEKEVKAIGQNSRGIKYSSYFGWTREVKAPAVLLEGAFIDSADRYIIDTIEEQQAFGVAYAKGVLAYLGIPYKEHTNKLYGVAKQELATSSKERAEAHARELNKQNDGSYYKVIEIDQ